MNPYDLAQQAAEVLLRHTGVEKFDVGVVFGSGWESAARELGPVGAELEFTRVPGFSAATAPGHVGAFRTYRVGGRQVLAMLGRVHLYEGYPPEAVVHGVRTLVRAGCSAVVLTNAAGGIRAGLEVGEPVLIRDHINFTGHSPLAGPNQEELGPRFPDLSDCYSRRLRELAQELDPSLSEGVYIGFPGPMLETPAEIRMAQGWGADLVGMSTVLEAIAASHLGAEVLGLSLVTNLAAGLPGANLDSHDILAVADRTGARTGQLLARLIGRLGP